MSENELEPLSPLSSALLGIERERPDAAEEVVARVYEGVAASIASSVGATAPLQPAASVVKTASSGVGLHLGRSSALALLAGTFLVGTGTGVLLDRGVVGRHSPVSSYVEPPRSSAVAQPDALTPLTSSTPTPALKGVDDPPPSPPEPKRVASLPVASGHAMSRVAPPTREGGVSSRDEGLAAERSMVEQARMALARGDNLGALDAVREHAREFPRGKLREEREAVAIQALAQAGQAEQARARAALFRDAFPASVFLPAIEIALVAR